MGTEVLTVLNTTKNTVLGDQIWVADTSLSRLVGLLGKRELQPGTGLLIVPSQAIHTVAMRFAIDVLFLDGECRVIHVCHKMVPYRLTGIHWKARSVLELPAGMISQTSTAVGDYLSFQD